MSESPAALCRPLPSEGEMEPAFGPTFAAGVFSELRPRCGAVEVSIFQKLLRRPPLRHIPCRGPAQPGPALGLVLCRQDSENPAELHWSLSLESLQQTTSSRGKRLHFPPSLQGWRQCDHTCLGIQGAPPSWSCSQGWPGACWADPSLHRR